MSESTGPAGPNLALEVAELGEEVRELTQRVAEQDQLLRSVSGGINAELDSLARKLKATAPGPGPSATPRAGKDTPQKDPPKKDEPPAAPRGWIQDATAEDWQELAEWVDWIGQVYQLPSARAVLPCWPAHPGVAEELAALRSAWAEAALKARAGPSDALIYWHDRWFYPALHRFREDTSLRQCSERHKEPWPVVETNSDLLAQVLADAPTRAVQDSTDPGQQDTPSGDDAGA